MLRASDSHQAITQVDPKYQLDDLMSNVAGCQALLQNTVATTQCSRENLGSANWLTEPHSALAHAQSLATVTDLQLEVLSAIESFSLLCDRIHRGCRNKDDHRLTASKALSYARNLLPLYRRCSTSSIAASPNKPRRVQRRGDEQSEKEDTLHNTCSSFGRCLHKVGGELSGLGTFKSSIIRQLWEIHRLLLALVEKRSPAFVASTLDCEPKQHPSMGDVKGIAVDHDEHIGWDDSTLQAKEIAHIEMESQHVECHNHRSPSPVSLKPYLELRKPLPQQQNQLPLQHGYPTSLNAQSASEWSFACAQIADRQLCFASTVCVDPVPATSTARLAMADNNDLKSCGTDPIGQPVWGDYVNLLSQTYFYRHGVESCASNDEATENDQDYNSPSTSSLEPYEKLGDSIVFRRVIDTASAQKKLSPQREPLMAALRRLKFRIDAIKLNLADSYKYCAVTRKSKHRHRQCDRKAARNSSNLCDILANPIGYTQQELQRIKKKLDDTLNYLIHL